MQNKIIGICQNLEEKENVRILFAVENGSRAWRMASSDSDYDVRFVFARPIEDYIKSNMLDEVINVSFDCGGKPCCPKGAFIDVSGFDVFKYARLLYFSNPTAIEWITTDIVYYGAQNEVFRKFALKNFNKISLYNHYKSLCRNNYMKYIKTGSDVTYKRYLYASRGLFNARFVALRKTVPPIIFTDALNDISVLMPDAILKKIYEIIKIKSQGKEKDKIKNIAELDEYIEDFLDESFEEQSPGFTPPDELDAELRRIVLSKF